MKTTYQGIQAVLRGKFILVNAYIKKEEKSQIKLIFYLKTWEKEQTKNKHKEGNNNDISRK